MRAKKKSELNDRSRFHSHSDFFKPAKHIKPAQRFKPAQLDAPSLPLVIPTLPGLYKLRPCERIENIHRSNLTGVI